MKGIRLPALLVVLGMLGLIAGASLIGLWAVGCAVMADSALMIAAGLFWPRPDPDDTDNRPGPVRDFAREL
jgi:hypothetical protein